MSASRLVVVTAFVFPLLLACSDDGDRSSQPKFTGGDGGTDSDTGDDSSGMSGGMTTGDGDPTTSGDGDPTTSGDGDPGDGDPNPTTSGDGDPENCETPPGAAGTSCGQDAGLKGALMLGDVYDNLPTGIITTVNNGPGAGNEDWYRFDFPLNAANPRPNAGTITLDFAINESSDYRFEIYRDCGSQVFGQGLAAEFGSNAPPLTEWTFNDLAPDPEQDAYADNVLWPTMVWVRVFRFQNNGACTKYKLQLSRE
jgi:hypothetical protein